MSRCRCSDISGTQNQISRLEKANGRFSGYYGRKDSVVSELQRCSGCANQSTISSKVVSYGTKMPVLCNGMSQTSSGISGKLSARLGQLKISLSGMRSEDRNYHEEQRRKAEEEARAAAAAALAAQRARMGV